MVHLESIAADMIRYGSVHHKTMKNKRKSQATKRSNPKMPPGVEPLVASMRIFEQSSVEDIPGLNERVQVGMPLLHLFGDESTSNDLVTYGLFIVDRDSVEFTEQKVEQVFSDFGGTETSRLHCSILFSGHKRQDSEWKHLSELDCNQFVLKVAEQLSIGKTASSVGLIWKNTYPKRMVSGPNQTIPLHDVHHYFTAFNCASQAFQCKGNFHPQIRCICNVDSLENAKYDLWGFGNYWVEEMMKSSNLRPIPVVDPKPLLIDAADLLAYSAARAYSEENYRNKEVCKQVIDILRPRVAAGWWNPQNYLNPVMVERLKLKAGRIRGWHNPSMFRVVGV